jgi:hypothetical protein
MVFLDVLYELSATGEQLIDTYTMEVGASQNSAR